MKNIFSKESSASSPPVTISYYMNIDVPELIKDNYFTIEDLFNGKYTTIDSKLQWPFVGKQYESIKWKHSDLSNTQTTVKVMLIMITHIIIYI